MKRMFWMAVALAALGVQQAKAEGQGEGKGKGKVILTTFANMYSGFGAANDERGFELERAYIGYQYSFNNGLSMQAVADFGRSKEVNDMQRIGFIKNAWVRWQRNGWDLSGGLISTTQFKTQEDFWGKRYVMKSFQDEYKFGSSADVGMSVAYQFCDRFSADVIAVNGEGYKKIQFGNGMQYGAGVTVRPADGMMVRLYGSYDEAAGRGTKGKVNLASFVGYAKKGYSVGAEFNYQMNTDYVEGQQQNGVSVYATIPAGKKVNVFARWDRLDSNNRWNLAEDGMTTMAGAEVNLGKYVKVTPNIRLKTPDDSSQKSYCELYINTSFKL